MKIEMSFVLLSALAITACGRDATVTDYKLAGVGLNPEEIAPEPEDYIGFVSYDFIDFSGGTLPLGLVGLTSFTGAGPELGTFAPPYSMVVGSGFFFDSFMPAPDVLFGSFGAAPSQIGKCHTVFEPRSYLSGIADGGSSIDFFTESGDGYSIGRRPLAYPPNASKVFPYYMGLSTFKSANRSWRNPESGDATDLSAWNPEEVSVNNFPFGENVSFSFKGAIASEEAGFGTIPQPYDSKVPGLTHALPAKSEGLMVSWTGTKYSGDGLVTGDGAQLVCMQFSTTGEAPSSVADCIDVIDVEPPAEGQYDRGQMYTGPWDTEEGVTIQWIPSTAGIDETVSISVRFLGSIDEEDSSFVEEVVKVKKTAQAQGSWDAAIASGAIPEGAECPEEGSRPALPCDEFVPEFDPSLRRGENGYIPSMQGNPLNNLVETTCAVDDAAGMFVITEDILEKAIDYAKQHNAAGAIFYFNRTTKTPFSIPEVRDAYGSKKEAGEMLVVSNSVQIGRFWVQDGKFE
jgi:hypothetical protein